MTWYHCSFINAVQHIEGKLIEEFQFLSSSLLIPSWKFSASSFSDLLLLQYSKSLRDVVSISWYKYLFQFSLSILICLLSILPFFFILPDYWFHPSEFLISFLSFFKSFSLYSLQSSAIHWLWSDRSEKWTWLLILECIYFY